MTQRQDWCSATSVVSSTQSPFQCQSSLVLFVTYMAQKCCYSTTRVYFSAVRYLHISNDYGDPCSSLTSLSGESSAKSHKRLPPKKYIFHPRIVIIYLAFTLWLIYLYLTYSIVLCQVFKKIFYQKVCG